MQKSALTGFQFSFTLVIALIIWGLLLWQHFNGGVPRHYILHSADMPSISNWWGAIILPALAWFLTGWVLKRESGQIKPANIYAFCGAALYGIILSVAFMKGIEPLASLMAPALLVLALFLPIFRPEYCLGFVLAMSYAFGAVLPTAFVIVVALLAAAIYCFIRPIPIWLYKKLRT